VLPAFGQGIDIDIAQRLLPAHRLAVRAGSHASQPDRLDHKNLRIVGTRYVQSSTTIERCILLPASNGSFPCSPDHSPLRHHREQRRFV
jgi:hypothetical protein